VRENGCQWDEEAHFVASQSNNPTIMAFVLPNECPIITWEERNTTKKNTEKNKLNNLIF